MAHWKQDADGENKPAFWRRIDGVILRPSVGVTDHRPLWEIVFPSGRTGTLPAVMPLQAALAKIDEQSAMPSWAFPPGIANQKGAIRAQGADCELTAGPIKAVPGEEGPDGAITFKLVNGAAIMRVHPDGRVVIEGEIVSREDPSIYQRFKPWLRAYAEQLTNGQFPGEIVFTPGPSAAVPAPGQPKGTDGSFVFRMGNGLEILRLRHDGAILVAGSLNQSPGRRTAFAAFSVWLSACSVISQPRQSR